MNFYFQLIIKSWKNYENLDFSTSGLCLAFKKFFGLFSIFLAFRYLEYSKSFKFELFWSNFAIKTVFAGNLAKRISNLPRLADSKSEQSNLIYLKVYNYRFVASDIRPIENSLQSYNRDFSANIQICSEDSFDFWFQTIHAFVNSSRIRFNAMKHQIVLPTPVNFV